MIRVKSNCNYQRIYSQSINRSTELRCDQTIRLAGYYLSQDYTDYLSRIHYYDEKTNKRFIFLANDFTLLAINIADLYRIWRQVELFFKWIMQHLRIKKFFGTSENAVKTQI